MSEGTGVPSAQVRNVPVDAAKTVAIFGTLLIHASAAGGFAGAVGSFGWTSALFWNCLIRCAVPLFLLCSGALMLAPEKPVTASSVWKRYIPRMLIALLFWAGAYSGLELLLTKLRTGVLELAAIQAAAKNLLLFNHKNHLYYLHIILLVYAVLPITRFFVAKADRRLLHYALGVWFILSRVYPTLRAFPPFNSLWGIPSQYVINLTWGAVGLGVLGHVIGQEAPNRRPRDFAVLYLLGTVLTFGCTLLQSLRTGALAEMFLQGNAPGVYLQAAGIYGFCVSALHRRAECSALETVSRASFCIYLVHLFFLDFLTGRGFAAGIYPPIWAVPVLVAVMFAAGFAVWLVLRRIPLVNRYLI